MPEQSEIGFENLGIGDVLARYRLVVPPNQREFAWEEEQVRTLFEDIAHAISTDQVNDFLGTIVTVPVDNGTLEVIDGQQRLATTSLALAAMQKLAQSNAPALARALESFLVSPDHRTLEMTPKMRLNTADTSVFHSLVCTGVVGDGYVPARASHQNLQDAFITATSQWRAIVRPVSEPNRVSLLQKWMNYIKFNAKVILLKVPNSANAFKMFETLNDRGLKTTQADLVKNYIFGEAGNSTHIAQEKWAFMRGALEAIEEDDITISFLRQAMICQEGYMRESELFDRVRAKVRGENTAIETLTTFEIQSRSYASLFNSNSPKWTQYPASAKKALEVLQLFNIRPLRPLLLALSERFDAAEAAKALQAMVSLAVRLIIASSTRSGSVEQPLARAAQQVHAGAIEESKELFKTLNGMTPSDEQFEEAFRTATVSSAKLARYYLRSLETAHREEPEPWFFPNEDALSITLEHVLPLRPEGNWPAFTADMVKLYARRIGNMALMQATANSSVRSDSFSDKNPVLQQSPYFTTAMIGSADDWGPSEIADRQEVLARLALIAWPAPVSF